MIKKIIDKTRKQIKKSFLSKHDISKIVIEDNVDSSICSYYIKRGNILIPNSKNEITPKYYASTVIRRKCKEQITNA